MVDVPKELILKAMDGDIEAFKGIYGRLAGYVFSVSYRITGNREDAEEVTQDVFLTVHRKLSSFGFRSAFTTWIYRVTMNAAITIYRKRSRERKRNVGLDAAGDAALKTPAKDDPSISLQKREAGDMIRVLLENLPEQQRICIILKDLEGLKYEEIAEVLNVNINTVRSRLNRGRKKLISIYPAPYGEPEPVSDFF